MTDKHVSPLSIKLDLDTTEAMQKVAEVREAIEALSDSAIRKVLSDLEPLVAACNRIRQSKPEGMQVVGETGPELESTGSALINVEVSRRWPVGSSPLTHFVISQSPALPPPFGFPEVSVTVPMELSPSEIRILSDLLRSAVARTLRSSKSQS